MTITLTRNKYPIVIRNMQEQTKLEYLISGNFDARYGLEIRRNKYRPVGNSVY